MHKGQRSGQCTTSNTTSRTSLANSMSHQQHSSLFFQWCTLEANTKKNGNLSEQSVNQSFNQSINQSINQPINQSTASLQDSYWEALPTQAKWKRTVLRRWRNWEQATFGRWLRSIGSPFQVDGPTTEKECVCIVPQCTTACTRRERATELAQIRGCQARQSPPNQGRNPVWDALWEWKPVQYIPHISWYVIKLLEPANKLRCSPV